VLGAAVLKSPGSVPPPGVLGAAVLKSAGSVPPLGVLAGVLAGVLVGALAGALAGVLAGVLDTLMTPFVGHRMRACRPMSQVPCDMGQYDLTRCPPKGVVRVNILQ
jgi:hypothetical protein